MHVTLQTFNPTQAYWVCVAEYAKVKWRICQPPILVRTKDAKFRRVSTAGWYLRHYDIEILSTVNKKQLNSVANGAAVVIPWQNIFETKEECEELLQGKIQELNKKSDLFIKVIEKVRINNSLKISPAEEILTIVTTLQKKYPDLRYTQLLFNLDVVEFADKNDPEVQNFLWKDCYNDSNEKVLQRIKATNLYKENF